jgi:hypothetical protein
MRPDCIKVAPPTFDDDLGLAQRIEDFATVDRKRSRLGRQKPASIGFIFAPRKLAFAQMDTLLSSDRVTPSA